MGNCICYGKALRALGAVAFSSAALLGQANVLTWHNDNARTGQNLQETILTPANVKTPIFGKLFQIATDGKVDAQTLYVPSLQIPGKGLHNVLFVMSEHDTAYAFDADNGMPLWSVTLLGANETPSDDRGCQQVTPEIGITATPAIDLQMGPHGTIYVVAMSKTSGGTYHQRLHALDLTTGSEEFGGPVEIQATYPGSGAEGNGSSVIFNPQQHEERSGLILVNGVLYTSWTSHCDAAPYTSWVIGYNESTLARTSVMNLTPNGSGGGIWGAGAGPSADAGGNLYVLLGNGTFDTTFSTGFPARGNYGNAFMKLSTTGGVLTVTDFFNMSNTVAESTADIDFGSGGSLVLPPLNDSHGVSRTLAVGAGKDGNIYVVDRNNMGKFNPGANSIFQELDAALPGGIWSGPAWFNGSLYYGPVGGHLKSFAFSNGTFSASTFSQSAGTFAYPGTTPSISANGTANGIVWAVENAGSAVLHAYDANNLATELYNTTQAPNQQDAFGGGNKFIVPTVVNGKVYTGTPTGVAVFGLLGGCSITVASNPSGRTVQFDGASYTTPQTISAACGSTGHTMATTTPQAGTNGTQYVWSSWSDGLAISHFVTVPASGGATYTANFIVSGAPNTVSVTPNSGGGVGPQVFSALYSDTNGASDLQVVYLDFGSVGDAAHDCKVAFAQGSNALYLFNDANTGALGPITLGGGGSLANSQCTLFGGSTAATPSGNNLTVPFTIQFKTGYVGLKNIFGVAQSYSGTQSGNGVFKALGTWTPAPATPGVVSVSPNSGGGVGPQTFMAVYSDTGGANDLQAVYLNFGSVGLAAHNCIAVYVPGPNTLYLFSDDNTAAAGPIAEGASGGSISNSQCTLTSGSTPATLSGNNLTVPFNITFKSGYVGLKTIFGLAQTYGAVQSNGGILTTLGSWQP